MTIVLITAIGGDVAQAVARVVRESAPNARLIGTDSGTRHGGGLAVDRLVILPPASAPEYVQSLGELVAEEEARIVIPISEPEIERLNRDAASFKGATLVLPGDEVVRAGVDKLETARAMHRLGIAGPWTVNADIERPMSYPCIFKSRFGSGSKNIFTVLDAGDAEFFARKFPSGIFQELLEGDDHEVTCAVYRSATGQTHVLQLLRKLAGGLTGWARVVNDPETKEVCTRLADALGLRGSMNVQLRLTSSGPRVFEINPRFSSTALMRHRLGFSDVWWAIREAEGLDFTAPPVPEGVTVVRTQNACVIQ